MHGRWILASLIAAAAAVSQTFEPQGETLVVPGEPDCIIYIAAWRNGTWHDGTAQTSGPKGGNFGTPSETSDAKRDIAEVKRWLEQMIAQSPDMQQKARKACEATGSNFMQIGIVRDDPEAGPGAWYRGTPVILVDMGDIEKLGQHTETRGDGNPSLQKSARLTVASLLPATLIAHELDHAMRAGDVGTRVEKEVLAMEDEDTVISELDAFKHATYKRKDYSDGTGRVTFTYKAASWPSAIEVKVNAGKALGRTGRPRDGHNHFLETSEDEGHAIDRIPHATWTPRQPETSHLTVKLSATFSRASTAPKVQTFAAVFERVFKTSPATAVASSSRAFFVSLGQTTGEAFKVIAVDREGTSSSFGVASRTLALRPLENVTERDIDRALMAMDGQPKVATTRIDGYCLDFGKLPPPAGMVFVPVDDSLQPGVEPVDRIVDVVRRLRERGLLKPDHDDGVEYAHDMVQWSIWTWRERFDEPRFTRAFVEHVRKNYQAAGDRWTRDAERAVTALAPARWTVIQRVLADAAALEAW